MATAHRPTPAGATRGERIMSPPTSKSPAALAKKAANGQGQRTPDRMPATRARGRQAITSRPARLPHWAARKAAASRASTCSAEDRGWSSPA